MALSVEIRDLLVQLIDLLLRSAVPGLHLLQLSNHGHKDVRAVAGQLVCHSGEGFVNQAQAIPVSEFLSRKMVAFVGTFDGGSTKLKDLVFAAGGAPTDNIPAFTDYIVIGRRGKETQAYKEASRMIVTGAIIELTDQELRDICAGKAPVPEPKQRHSPDVFISPALPEYEREAKMGEAMVFEAKRAAFVHRYGVLQPDGSRDKRYLG